MNLKEIIDSTLNEEEGGEVGRRHLPHRAGDRQRLLPAHLRPQRGGETGLLGKVSVCLPLSKLR